MGYSIVNFKKYFLIRGLEHELENWKIKSMHVMVYGLCLLIPVKR